jgi:hypothetical protein
MHAHAAFALAHPVYDPERDMLRGHGWRPTPRTSAMLTVNIGQE